MRKNEKRGRGTFSKKVNKKSIAKKKIESIPFWKGMSLSTLSGGLYSL